jgi:hypothetical protein
VGFVESGLTFSVSQGFFPFPAFRAIPLPIAFREENPAAFACLFVFLAKGWLKTG